MRPLFLIKKSGLYSTIQDKGRYGYQQYGMVVSGPMDLYSYQLGNILVGNPRDYPSIEITLIGPEIEWIADATIAITGANLKPKINGLNVPLWKTLFVKKGQVLSFGERKEGVRCYLSINGLLQSDEFLGSRATYRKGKIGGFFGRELQKNDVVYGEPGIFTKRLKIPHPLVPLYNEKRPIRVLAGPEHDAFTEKGVETFYSTAYKITPQSDRMGFRLEGEGIEHKAGADILSDAVTFGTVQVPANGKPIIMLADRQTTGGYTRIATVISVDIPYLVQCLPGETIRFQETTVEKAQFLFRKLERMLITMDWVVQKNN